MGTIEEVGALALCIAADLTFTTGAEHIISGGAELGKAFMEIMKQQTLFVLCCLAGSLTYAVSDRIRNKAVSEKLTCSPKPEAKQPSEDGSGGNNVSLA